MHNIELWANPALRKMTVTGAVVMNRDMAAHLSKRLLYPGAMRKRLARQLANRLNASYGLSQDHHATELSMLTVKRLSLVMTIVLLGACSSESGTSGTKERHEHVWRTQTDALDKTRQVEGLLNDSASRPLGARQ